VTSYARRAVRASAAAGVFAAAALVGGLAAPMPTVRLNDDAPLSLRRDGAADLVASGCDSDGVSAGYDTVFTAAGYAVTAVTVSQIDGGTCAERSVVVALTDAAGGRLGEGSASLSRHEQSVRVPIVGAPPAATIAGIAITIA
jgi:hypothetical protein